MLSLSDKLGKNISKSLIWVCRRSERRDLHITATLRDKLTIYVVFKTANPRIKSNLTNYVLTATVAQDLNDAYGSDFSTGNIQSGSPDRVSVQYTAQSTLGSLLD